MSASGIGQPSIQSELQQVQQEVGQLAQQLSGGSGRSFSQGGGLGESRVLASVQNEIQQIERQLQSLTQGSGGGSSGSAGGESSGIGSAVADANAVQRQTGASTQGGGPSLNAGWGISGGQANAGNTTSDYSKLAQDLQNGGSQRQIKSDSLQLAIDADAGGNSSLATDAQNVARSVDDGSFSASGSLSAIRSHAPAGA